MSCNFYHFPEILYVVRFQGEASKKLRHPVTGWNTEIILSLNLLSEDSETESVHGLVLLVKLCQLYFSNTSGKPNPSEIGQRNNDRSRKIITKCYFDDVILS